MTTPIRHVPQCANYEVIKDCIRRLKRPVSYLEIGCNEGHSLYRILETGLVREAVAIDTWGNKHGGTNRGSPAHVVELLGSMASLVRLVTGNSQEVLPQLSGEFDVIFVDGDHSRTGALLDLTNSLPLLSADGYIVVDDIDNAHARYIRRICGRFAMEKNLKIAYYPDAHQGVAVLSRKPILR